MNDEILTSNLDTVWDEFCGSLQDYPTDPNELRKLWGKFVRVLGFLGEERARQKRIISKHTLQEEPKVYLEKVRGLVSRSTAFDERKLYMILSAPEEQKKAIVRLEEVEAMIELTYRMERVLKGYYQVMALDMKLSFEGHE